MTETQGMPIPNMGRVEGGVNLSPRPPVHEQELPEERLFELISAFGNHEAKALTLIAMGNGNIFAKGDLYRTIIDHQGKQRGWEVSNHVPFDYCQYSLSPIGLVTREVLDPDLSTYGYQITEYGKTTGVDLAGVLLKWSYDHPNISLYQMLGSTSSTGSQPKTEEDRNRSPKMRYKIFFELATNPDSRVRETDIANALGVDRDMVKSHLQSLGKIGIITYEHPMRGKPVAFYRLKGNHPEEEPVAYKKLTTLTPHVYSLLRDNQGQTFLSLEDLTSLLLDKLPSYKEWSGAGVKNTITAVCKDLERQGYAERVKFSDEFQSEITLTDEQKEVIVSLIEVLDRFQTGDMEIKREGREFSQRVMADPNLFSTLILKAKEASPIANRQSKEQSTSDILSIIAGFPGIAVLDLQAEYEKRVGRHVSINTIGDYTRDLTKQGLLVSEGTKSGNVYRINPQTE